jgi:UDP:flavonoid glycosyltransferase YjiC (YdhE family)
MRVVLTCQPSRGHFEPLGPIARALCQAGHEAIFATSASFVPVVQENGFQAVPAGLDWLESEADRAFPDLVRGADGLHGSRNVWSMVFARSTQAMLSDLLGVLTSLSADLVVSEGIEFAGSLAAEALDLPHARAGIAAFRPLPVAAVGLGALYNHARIGLGLSPDPQLERYCPHLYLDLFPPSLQSLPLRERFPVTHVLRPEPFAAARRTPPAWLADLDDAPLVLVSLGTVFNRSAGRFELLLEALRDERINLVLAVGENRDPAEFGVQPANVHIERTLPFSAVLSRADVLICHAPYTTMIAALTDGVPMLCLPFAADQHYNAFAIAACGCGLHLDWRAATPEAVRAAVRELLDDPLYRGNAERLRREIVSLPPIESAVALLEDLPATARR